MKLFINYIKNGIPISYMLVLKFTKFKEFIRGLINKIFLKKCGKNFKVGKNTKLFQKRRMIIGDNVTLGANSKFDALSDNGIIMGNNVSIADYSIIACTGSLKHLGKGIKIGNNVHFGEFCFMGAAGGIDIGNDVIGGQNIRFHSENHRYSNSNIPIYLQGVTHKGIKIGNNCWIGAGAVFLDGSEIGDGCVVAANAVVSGKFENNVVIGGIPAKIIKNRIDD